MRGGAPHRGGSPSCRASALGTQASVAEHRGSVHVVLQLLLLSSMWDLPRPGVKPMSPASAGRSLPTVPSGKSAHQTWIYVKSHLSYLFKGTFTHPNPEESDSVGLEYRCSMNHTWRNIGIHYISFKGLESI